VRAVSLYVDMESTVVDLYGLRCAIAVLVHARHNIDDLTTANLLRFDAAIRNMSRNRKQMQGALAANTNAIFSTDPDPAGRRTVQAIDQLAELAHVSEAAAPALAASLSLGPTQGVLFDGVNEPL
jgi:hypothetical protein